VSVGRVIEGRAREIDGFAVRRVLPSAACQRVGPFVFLDHMGPASLAAGRGLDVRPHPHIGLATVTYLYGGVIVHRDSLGFDQEILPGDVNWMTAGRGIVHSERSPARERVRGPALHGIQSWVALPDGFEEVEPSFAHHPAGSLPTFEVGGVALRVVAGEAFGRRSPVAILWPTLYVDAALPAGATLELPPEYTERAIYVVEGRIDVEGRGIEPGSLAVLDGGSSLTIGASAQSRVMLLGGERFPRPRTLWWNFVASSPERIETAKRDWAAGHFGQVPGETEFIPLPVE
jgi:redox-sensitive bicupin YhaK (pirin superfamily)